VAQSRASLDVYRESFAPDAALDTGVSHALLRAVDAGEQRESFRLYRPGDALAFSVLDRTRPGFGRALEIARAAGFEPILRLAGGRAAVFESEGLAFAWTVPARNARAGIRPRFVAMAAHIEAALRKLGVDARTGEVPGEYCPGEFSVNARGTAKVMGVGQRVLRGAAHVGGVLVVRQADRVRSVLEEVYDALEFPFDPKTTGSLEDEVAGLDAEQVAHALLAEIASDRQVELAPLPEAVLARGRELAPAHVAVAKGSREAGSLQVHGKIIEPHS